jgi:hypothetical protein
MISVIDKNNRRPRRIVSEANYWDDIEGVYMQDNQVK